MTGYTQRRWARGTAALLNGRTGVEGEINVDLTAKTLRVFDGVTPGGVSTARADLANVPGSTDFGRAVLAWANVAAGRAALSLVPGVNVQAQNAGVQAIADLVSAADRLAYFTGAGTAALAVFTAAGRALVGGADAAAQRAALGLGTAALVAHDFGLWTPIDGSGAGLTLTTADSRWIKIGRLVVASFYVQYPSTASGAQARVAGLPYTSVGGVNQWGGCVTFTDYGSAAIGLAVNGNGTSLDFHNFSGGFLSNANLSNKQVRATVLYHATS